MKLTRDKLLLLTTAGLILLLVWLVWQGKITVPGAEKFDFQTTRLESQGTSDEVSSIERDLDATDLSNLDRELTDIERELSSF